MKKIIALRGAGSTGKTSTIRLLYNMLLANGYEYIYSTFENEGRKKDFLAVFIKDGKKIGISSMGDLHDIVKDNLENLITQDCIYCVCACRTSDRKKGGIIRGTNAAIDSFVNFAKEYVDKTIEKETGKRAEVNQNDAERLFWKLDSLCLMPLV